MRHVTKRLLLWSGASIFALIAISLICISCYTGTDLFKPRPIVSVKPEAWAQLRVGMSKEAVIHLLGNSPAKYGPSTMEACYQKINIPEFWQYNWTDAMNFGRPSDKAYVVYFDASNQVSRFRAPLDSSAAAATNPSSVVPWPSQIFALHPQEADFIALCNVRVESNRVIYTVSEVWKGQKYLSDDFKARPQGLVLLNEKQERYTEYGNLALAWYKGRPGTTNFFGDNPCRSMSLVENGMVTIPSTETESSTISLNQLRRQIAD
jgi:outer membrane protein assembly factor BamE (lipoprotein component of BamABCDE complex)